MYSIGIVPAPGVCERDVRQVVPRLKQWLSAHVDSHTDWHIEVVVDLVIESAEDMHASIDRADRIKQHHNWDMVICVTDLPSISGRRVVISDYDVKRKLSMISLPSLGAFRTQTKLLRSLQLMFQRLYEPQVERRSNMRISPLLQTKKVEPDEETSQKVRLVNALWLLSWIQLLLGMTRINEPWKALLNFKKIISVAFATGTYVAIFSMPWELSVVYSPWRFIFLMCIAVFGMTFWLIYAHQLREKSSSATQTVYRRIYNMTTLLSLLLITLLNYMILYVLLSISVTMFVPLGLFNSWTSADVALPITNYMKLIWFVASLGLLAGAMGSTVEDEQRIRQMTYSYRQYYRYETIQKEQESYTFDDTDSDDTTEYKGKKQDHREEGV
ncbi:5,10-methylene-tetrahydrofolate dehydrogenase [Staphylococcus canis]|uniref:5,10-methylene-tetrahydrofolate dehydrogenase n=1 Tax=Staphylococcus canis TaxID=2724942 RepID=A0ABS0T6T2_9STAP|nr:5,10-methylene-tetrahydrofolate dehydrogenase [Staphylococcus canis]MBI5974453.1 5,10-methylene-tetrahydrofolate dehydrogenase [Staphylococcus canis]